MILQTILINILLTSLCLLFEISTTKKSVSNQSKKETLFVALKTLIIIIVTVVITFYLLKFVLIKLECTILLPFVILLFLIGFSLALESLNLRFFKNSTNEYILSFISIFIATNNANYLLNSLLIAITSVLFYYLLLYILYCIEKRNKSVIKSIKNKIIPSMLLTLAIIIIASYSWNLSWLSIRFY